jgi:hypothetical protein
VAKRKYRPSAAISSTGRGIKADDAAPPGQLPLSDAEAASPSAPASDAQVPRGEYGKPEAEPAQHFSTGLKEQLAQQQRYADRPQPQQQQIDPLAAYLLSIHGLTVPKFHFLYHYFAQHPDRLNPAHWDVLKAAHGITLNRGVGEDSPEYFHGLHALLQQHAATPPPPQAAPAPAPPMPEQHRTHIDLEKVESSEGEPEGTHMSAMFSAPVSRGEHATAVEPEPTMGTIKLSAEQRDMAHRSGISEVEYAKQLLRMQKMQKSGLIK